jgi:hypothetical protein
MNSEGYDDSPKLCTKRERGMEVREEEGRWREKEMRMGGEPFTLS